MILSPIIRSLITVSTGVACSQVLTLFAMPILSRYYSPESFGILGTFITIASILGMLATLQYGVALMLPKSDSEAANVFMLGCLSVASLTFIITIVIAVFPTQCGALMMVSGQTHLLLLLPMFILFNGANLLLIGWGVRRKQFRQNATSQIMRSLTLNGIQLAAAPVFATGGVLVAGAVMGELSSFINLGHSFWKNERRFFQRCFSIARMKRLAISYVDFPAFSTPQNLINAAAQGLPILLLGKYFSIETAGFYALAIRLIQSPMGLLLTPLRQVLFQKFCEIQNQDMRIISLYRKSTFAWALI